MAQDKKPMLEHVIETTLERQCRERGWMCPKTASPGRGGFPDRTVITDKGVVVFVEVKRPKEVPRKLQVAQFLRPLAEHNANVVVVDTIDAVNELMHQLEQDISPKPRDLKTFYIQPCDKD